MPETYVSPPALVKGVRTSQPAFGRVDWSNPLTRGLVAASIGGTVVFGGGQSKPSTGITKSGIAFQCTGTTFLDLGDCLNNTLPVTLVALATHNNRNAAASSQPNLISAGDRIALRSAYSGYDASFYSSSGVSTWAAVTLQQDGSTPDSGAEVFYAGVCNPLTLQNRVYQSYGGRLRMVESGNGGRMASVYPVRIGLENEAGRSMGGACTMAAVFTRALSSAEIASLAANPWQLFAAEPSRLFSDAIAPRQLVTPRQSQMLGTTGVGVAGVSYVAHGALSRATPIQSPSGARLLRTNPLTRGLVFANLPGIGFDAVAQTLVGASTGSARGTAYFSAVVGKRYQVGLGARLGLLQDSTILAVALTSKTPSAGGSAVYAERASSGSDIYKLGLSATGLAQFVMRDDAAVTVVLNNTQGASLLGGRPKAIAGVKRGTTLEVYDEVSMTSITSNVSNAFTNANLQLIGADAGDGGADWVGSIYLVLGWDRALSPVELRSVLGNPWQIFAPDNRKIWVPT